MTHGEDLSSDMHQDSVVLTYLESVLMRRAAAANAGIPADKSDGDGGLGAGSGAEGPAPPAAASAAPSRGLPPPPPPPPRSVPAPNLNVNVKKARLLQSEDWQGAHKRRRVSAAGGPEPALQPTHSTLLASLLQSFSSSLQGRGAAPTPDSPTPAPEQRGEAGGCGRPGALLDARGGGGGGGGESSRSGSRNNSPAASASAPSPRLSCSARLKAVASMVGKGTLPAPGPGPGPGGSSSPKPSAACSQLALLLSSDCQLQQYSRARSLAPSASQRLAAIACKKQVGAVTPPRERCQRSPASPASAAGTVSGSGGSSSSLLMHLLNSPKLPATNGHMWGPPGQGGRTPPRGRRPLKEEGEGGDPCPRSACTPMDLSTKARVCDPATLHPGSLEQMTESLLFSWNPTKVPGLRAPVAKVEQEEEEEGGPDTKSHHKVTLLQLLLGHPDGTQGDGTPEPGGEAPRPASLGRRPALTEPFPSPAPVAETNPVRKPRRPQPFPTPGEPLRMSQSRPQQEAAKARHSVEQPPAATPPYTKQVFPTPPGGPSAPLAAADSRLSNFSFSASKLLHDLAHTGNLKSPEPSQVEAEAEARLCGPSPLDAKPPVKGPLGVARGGPGPGPGPGPDLAQLLERRSVLQLLLRNPEKEQAHRARRVESPQSRAYAQAAADVVRVKVEPAEQDCDAFPNAQRPRAAPCGAADTVKLEAECPSPPAPAHSAHSAARGGVLSQLLLRHGASPPEAYPAGALQSPHHPCPMTRIRHLLPASPPERRDSHKKPGRTLNGHSFGPNGMSEAAAGTIGNGRAPEPGHRGYLKDAPGFNVLKQLLLSENGIKVLSQHRGLQNGAPARESNHHHPKPPTSAAAPGHFYQLKVGGKESPAGAEPARHPGSARLPPPPRPAAHHEPPWLTKANPILYYMLQRSGGEAQAFGLAEDTAETAAAAASVSKERRGQLLRAEAQGRAGPGWVKQEPEESLACFRPHPAQPPLTPGQILEKVAAIKREPD